MLFSKFSLNDVAGAIHQSLHGAHLCHNASSNGVFPKISSCTRIPPRLIRLCQANAGAPRTFQRHQPLPHRSPALRPQQHNQGHHMRRHRRLHPLHISSPAPSPAPTTTSAARAGSTQLSKHSGLRRVCNRLCTTFLGAFHFRSFAKRKTLLRCNLLQRIIATVCMLASTLSNSAAIGRKAWRRRTWQLSLLHPTKVPCRSP